MRRAQRGTRHNSYQLGFLNVHLNQRTRVLLHSAPIEVRLPWLGIELATFLQCACGCLAAQQLKAPVVENVPPFNASPRLEKVDGSAGPRQKGSLLISDNLWQFLSNAAPFSDKRRRCAPIGLVKDELQVEACLRRYHCGSRETVLCALYLYNINTSCLTPQ